MAIFFRKIICQSSAIKLQAKIKHDEADDFRIELEFYN